MKTKCGCNAVSKRFTSLPLENMLIGAGINKSVNRADLPLTQLYTCNNIEPTSQGLSNQNIGVSCVLKSNSNMPIRAGISFQGNQIFVREGNLYKWDSVNETLLLSNCFDPEKKPVMEYMVGGSPRVDKLYICDGVNPPVAYDGNTAITLSIFSSVILGQNFGNPQGFVRWRNRMVYFFPPSSPMKDWVLGSDENNAESFTLSLATDAGFFAPVALNDGNRIAGLGVLKRDNARIQEEVLIAIKDNFEAYQAHDVTVPDPVGVSGQISLTAVFNMLGVDIGTVSQHTIINFANDLVMMSSKGIGTFRSATESGGIDANTYEAGIRINDLIKKASQSIGFENSFALHCPARQLIMYFMPSDIVSENGYSYPEPANDLAVCLKYGVQTKAPSGDNLDVSVFFTRYGKGWAWASAWVDKEKIYLGSYFGDIYELYTSDEYERNPFSPDEIVPITSTIETGDMYIGATRKQYFSLMDLEYRFFVLDYVQASISIYWNECETGAIYPNKKSRSICNNEILEGEYAIWGDGEDDMIYGWDMGLWGGEDELTYNTHIRLNPSGAGQSVRMKIEWDSLRGGIDDLNWGAFYGITGRVRLGSEKV